jgi:phosphopantetheinyl transferase
MGACIGVDIEQIKPRKNHKEIASILGWQEDVRTLSDFLSKWTLWEASVKCFGSSSLTKPNPEFAQLDHRYSKGRVGAAGHWNGLHDRLGKDAYYAIVLKSRHNPVLVQRRLEPGKIKPW